jgi:hypothetical protein
MIWTLWHQKIWNFISEVSIFSLWSVFIYCNTTLLYNFKLWNLKFFNFSNIYNRVTIFFSESLKYSLPFFLLMYFLFSHTSNNIIKMNKHVLHGHGKDRDLWNNVHFLNIFSIKIYVFPNIQHKYLWKRISKKRPNELKNVLDFNPFRTFFHREGTFLNIHELINFINYIMYYFKNCNFNI